MSSKVEEQPQEAAGKVEDDPEEPNDGVPRVLVTGASGYVASHLIKALLQGGHFRIRGTVRSLKKKEKVQPLRDLVPDAKYPLRLIQADLGNAESWKKAVESCSYVFHVASPFPVSRQIKDEDIVPVAVGGTKNVLQACADAGTVKRVVLTSSIAAISCGILGHPDKPQEYIYSEADWSPESACAPYEKSKLKAEQFAWDFVKTLEGEKKFELAVVNPGYVQGPLLHLASGQGSMLLGMGLLSGEPSGILDIPSFPVVDVRDVVKSEIAAMEKPEAAGNRYVLVTDAVLTKDIIEYFQYEFKPQGYKVASKDWSAMPVMKTARFNNKKMVEELGVKPYSTKDTIIDTCYSIVDLGGFEKTPGYLGHPSTR